MVLKTKYVILCFAQIALATSFIYRTSTANADLYVIHET